MRNGRERFMCDSFPKWCTWQALRSALGMFGQGVRKGLRGLYVCVALIVVIGGVIGMLHHLHRRRGQQRVVAAAAAAAGAALAFSTFNQAFHKKKRQQGLLGSHNLKNRSLVLLKVHKRNLVWSLEMNSGSLLFSNTAGLGV
jgi:hypothetical protein